MMYATKKKKKKKDDRKKLDLKIKEEESLYCIGLSKTVEGLGGVGWEN